jgi:hypothetical protein
MDQMNQNKEMGSRADRQQQGPLIQDEDSINVIDLLDNLLQYRWQFIVCLWCYRNCLCHDGDADLLSQRPDPDQ